MFQGRFKAILFEFESWGIELSRYIHFNPVRILRYELDKKSRAAERLGFGEPVTPELIVCYILMSNHYPVVVDGPPDLDERPFGRGARQSVLLALPGPCRLRIEQKSVHGLVSIERPLNFPPSESAQYHFDP